MKFFQSIKGQAYGLGQIDKILPLVKDDEDTVAVERGSCLIMTANGDGEPIFKRATDATSLTGGARVFFSLHAEDDSQAGMAGTVGGNPVIGGLDCGADGEFETEMYDAVEDYVVNQYLTVDANSKLTPVTDLTKGTVDIVGQVTKAPATRWRNEVASGTALKTGGNVTYLTYKAMWLPSETIET